MGEASRLAWAGRVGRRGGAPYAREEPDGTETAPTRHCLVYPGNPAHIGIPRDRGALALGEITGSEGR